MNKIHYSDKEIYFYWITSKDVTKVYNGSETVTITTKERIEYLRNDFSYDFLLVKYDGKKDIKQSYRDYIENVDQVKRLTGYNLYRFSKIVNATNYYFMRSTQIVPENIHDYEFDYIMNSGGGFRFSKKYTGKAWKYDINSFYPSLLTSNILRIPIKKGTIKEIDNLDDIKYFKYGVYNVEIIGEHPFFYFNSNNFYTHYELNYARSEGLTIKNIGKHLIYGKSDIVKASDIFSDYIDPLFKHKSETKNPIFKELLNSLWGSLVQTSFRTFKICSKIENVDDNIYDIIKMNPIDDDTYEFTLIKKHNKNSFINNYARLKPFLLSLARVKMYGYVKKIGIDNIVFSHTDSFITTKYLTNSTKIPFNNTKMGYFKFEGCSNNCIVSNMNTYKF